MAYVYKHIIKDTNQPFYIGVGGLISFDNYQRANAKNWKGLRSRSDFWKNIVDKYGFTVEIVLDNCTKEEALNKEIELIKLYGRQDISTGILVNHTDGGEGNQNFSEENREKLKYWKGKSQSEETKLKLKNIQAEKREYFAKYGVKMPSKPRSNTKKPVIKRVAWNKGIPHTEESKRKMAEAGLRRLPPSEETKLKISMYRKGMGCPDWLLKSISKKVIDTSTGIVYSSCTNAAKEFNINKGTLNSRLIGKCKNYTTLRYLINE